MTIFLIVASGAAILYYWFRRKPKAQSAPIPQVSPLMQMARDELRMGKLRIAAHMEVIKDVEKMQANSKVREERAAMSVRLAQLDQELAALRDQ